VYASGPNGCVAYPSVNATRVALGTRWSNVANNLNTRPVEIRGET
jgi:hypothetical protein